MALRLIAPLCVVASLILLSHDTAAAPPAPWEIDEMAGRAAPEFVLPTPDGGKVSLAQLRGKIVLLNFWATWCPPCKEEFPVLNRLQKKYRGRDFVVVGIATDFSAKDVSSFIRAMQPEFLLGMDTERRTARDYKVFSLPTSFLVDQNGKIVERFLGAEDWLEEGFIEKVESLLKKTGK